MWKKILNWFTTRTWYVVEYKNFEGEWTVRGEYKSYQQATARWRNHYRHCPYLPCRITCRRGVRDARGPAKAED